MKKNLAGKTVVVAGASRSIGRRIAHRFGSAGANLILPWFDWPDSVFEMREAFSSAGYSFIEQKCDLRRETQVQEMIGSSLERFGRIDILVNNIERGGMPSVHGSYEHDHNRDQWALEIDTTLKAKWNLFNSCKESLRTSPGGAVINISSISAFTGRSGPAACFFNDAYSAANRAVRTFTESWAREMAPEVRVNEVMLGLVRSRHGEETRGWSVLSEEEKSSLQDRILLSRQGTPDEAADLVYYLAVHATYITGTVIRMDGGYLLGGDRVPPMPPGIL